MKIGERIKYFRHTILSVNQDAFAKSLYLSQPYLSKIESGNVKISEQILFLLSVVYNLNIEWINNGEGNMYNIESEIFKTLGKVYKLSEEDLNFITYYINVDSTKKETLRKLHRIFDE